VSVQTPNPRILTPERAARFADIALGHVGREYPNKLDHVLDGEGDAKGPRALHPIFYGSFDWHSCVHSYWMLAILLRLFPDGAAAGRIAERFDAVFTPQTVAGELAYLQRPSSRGFERPYGWGWLLMLAAELERGGTRWAPTLRPLAQAFAERFRLFLPKADYPVRAGAHGNTAFALRLALEYAEVVRDAGLLDSVHERARLWYGRDQAAPAWEPSGDDFLSPTLVEAQLMAKVLDAEAFAAWFAAFLPEVDARRPQTLFTPASVSDRSDGKIAHLDGVNLSRAWGWRELSGRLHPRAADVALQTADAHLEASLPHVAGDYMGEHWLATYATLALAAGR
jgi:hypothetical protein